MITLGRLIGVALFGCFLSCAADDVVDLQSVAQRMKFPQDHLVLNDITAMMRNRLGDGVLASQEVRGRDENVFHPMSFIVAESRTLLSDEIVRKSDDYLEGMKGKPEQSKGLRRMVLPDGSWGYVGLEGFGPGGALIAATFTDATRTRDVKIIIACGNQPLVPVEGGEAYGKLFSGEIDATSGITALAESLVKTAQAIDVPLKTTSNQHPVATSPNRSKARNATSPNEGLAENAQQHQGRGYTLWAVLFVGVVIVLIVMLKRGLRS